MNLAIISVTGNAQGRETATGMERLWDDHLRQFATPQLTVYQPATWKLNTRRRMEQLQRLHIEHVFFVGYSHGQAAIMQMCRMAPRYGIRSIQMALCDPVGRNPLLPRWGWAQMLSARSITPWMRIKIPETVSRVVWCRQFQNRPRAHNLKWNPETTHVEEALEIPVNHSVIQWHRDWFGLALDAVNKWVNPPKAIPIKMT